MAKTKRQTAPKDIAVNTVTNVPDVFRDNFKRYAKAVVKDRALPDVRDGLKPVQRAIMIEMHASKATSKNRPVKVARLSGAVIGKWHPHGDGAVEEAMAGMAAPWLHPMPIIEIIGNGGNIGGDGAAAGRYIEAQTTPTGDSYIVDLRPGVVPYTTNYDESETMPEVMPAKLPYLLINGAFGIAVGESTSIPTHNPVEVVSAFIKYASNNRTSVEDLLKLMPGPDFPTGGQIINKSALAEMYKKGEGKIRVRGKMRKDEKTRTLHIYEVPFTVSGSVDNLTEELVNATNESIKRRGGKDVKVPPRILGVTDVTNYSDKDGMDIQITAEKGVDLDNLMMEIYAKTKMESTLSLKFNALNDQNLYQYDLKRYFKEYLDHQHLITKNYYTIEADRLSRQLEIVEGMIKLEEVIDEVVASARASNGREQLVEVLMTGLVLDVPKKFHAKIRKFNFTELQAQEIAKLPIYRINRMDYANFRSDHTRIQKELDHANQLVSDPEKRKKHIIAEHKEKLKQLEKASFARKTELIDAPNAVASKIEVPEVDVYVAMDKYGYLQVSHKNFDGAVKTSNKRRLGFVDESSVVWNLFLDNVKDTTGRGTFIEQLISGKRIVGFTSTIDAPEERLGLFVYSDGNARLTKMSDYMTKTRATAVKGGKSEYTLLTYVDVPAGTKKITLNGKTFPISKFSKQGKTGHGKKMIDACESVDVTFE